MMRTGMVTVLMVVIIICSTSLAGCWNVTEPTNRAIVLALGYDYDEERGLFKAIAQVAKPIGATLGEGGSTGNQKAFEVISAQGKTPFEAMKLLGMSSTREIFWGHTRVILFSEKMARHGLREIFDAIERRRLTRLISRPAVIQGDIQKLMEADFPLDDTGAAGIDKLLNTATYENSAAFPSIFIKLFSIVEKSGIEMFIGRIKILDDREEKEGNGGSGEDGENGGDGEDGNAGSGSGSGGMSGPPVQFDGGAFFKGDRMVGWASQYQGEGLLYALGGRITFNLVIDCPGSSGEYISIEVYNPESRMVPAGEGRKVRVELEVKATGSMENITCYKDIMDEDFMRSVERRVAQAIRNRICDMLKRSQEMESDVFGFGFLFARKRPQIWEEIGDDWDQIYPHLAVDLDVRFKLIRSGLVQEPINTGQ